MIHGLSQAGEATLEMELSMQYVSDPSRSTAVERRGGKQEWAEGEVQL